ncbi:MULTISPECIES: DNA polymerase I [Polyangium]|uniref:DNA polymerase I n=2 Tax=Polyangium TaxID=55 RepID=A0A4U1JKK2_9BACT|nr:MULTISPECIES: DNA polymerase I [Polyangium]MDI1431914.1 DNA polymerase I [Polyangium sorediatum]TKD13165.1 DNA polymerase I [Polyangium fumosum]
MVTRKAELPPPGASDVLYIIDLSGYVFRAYHAIQTPLTSPTGEPTHATYGTVSMLSKLVDERKPAFLAVAMDSPGRTFRDDLDENYKAHRPPAPPDLHVQMARCKEIVEAYRIPIYIADGLEADDLLAVAVARAKERGLRVVIVSSDKDLMQLVDADRVMLWDGRDKVYGPAEVEEKFGVPPTQLRDLLALVGDTSDNVPGVPGVGVKTAADLLKEFATLDGIYAGLDRVKRQKIRDNLREHEADARLSQKLVSLHMEAQVDFDFEALRYGGADVARLRALFTELGFTRFIKAVPAAAPVGGSRRAIATRDEFAAFAAEVQKAGKLAIEVHATSREAMRAHVCGLALAYERGQSVYVPIGHRYLGVPAQLGMSDVAVVLGPILSDPAIAKLGHDLKFVDVLLRRHGLSLRGATFDTMLASYLLDSEASHELADVAERDAGVKMQPFEELAPKKRGQAQRALDDVEIELATGYAAAFPEVALTLVEQQTPRLEAAHLGDLFTKIELPLASVLAQMEYTGVLVDPKALASLGEEMAKELAVLEKRAHDAAGKEWNLASPRQLETILFDELKLRSLRKTKTGRSTDADVLEQLSEDHPLPGIVLEHRAIAKLKGTYVDALPKLVHPETGRIHTRWSQAVAATGRLSSQDPNLQNIPIRTELGRHIRRAFVAPPGFVVLSADYSQIELRVLAHLSKDPVLVDAFRTGQDVHTRTAMEIFSVEASEVTVEMRRRSKTINFGVIYGMGEAALARRLDIPRVEAARFINAYFQRYRGVHEFMERTMTEARHTQVVQTMLGRRRMVPDVHSSDRGRRAYAERIAQNTPIQGSSADLLKLAMVRLGEPVVPGARMVLTVHDELTFEVPADRVEEAKAKVREVMETVFPLDVPLVVDVGAGPTWADAH